MNTSWTAELAIYSLGLVFGLGAALFLALLWLIFGVSTLEYFREKIFDRMFQQQIVYDFPQDPHTALADSRARTIIISDLHADRWQDAQHFLNFIETISANTHIQRLIINGDIADYPGDMSVESGMGLPRILSLDTPEITAANASTPLHLVYATLRHAAKRKNNPLKSTYILGNHDIGLYGLKGEQVGGAFGGAFEAIWQPSVMSDPNPSKATYFEHGQRFDPLLVIYMRYVILDMLRGSNSGRDTVIMDALARASSATVSSSDVTPTTKSQPGWYEKILIYRYRAAARYCLDQYGTRNISFGHTHLPDRYVFSGGRTYVNSGDWSIKSRHQNFSVIDEDGNLHGPFDLGK